MVDNPLQQYQFLRNEWMRTYDINQKRDLANQELIELTGAIQSVNNYSSYNPSPYNPSPYNPSPYNPSPYNPGPYNPYSPYNPYTN